MCVSIFYLRFRFKVEGLLKLQGSIKYKNPSDPKTPQTPGFHESSDSRTPSSPGTFKLPGLLKQNVTLDFQVSCMPGLLRLQDSIDLRDLQYSDK